MQRMCQELKLRFYYITQKLDERINKGWPDYEAALKANKKVYTAHIYKGCNHGFHNDSTPRYDKTNADLAWKRTIEFFEKNLA